jgi:hypothetical protein
VTDNRRRPVHSDIPDARENGVAMIGTLAVVIIVGILVTIGLSTNHPDPQGTTQESTDSGAVVTTTTVPQSVGRAAKEAAVLACQLNFQVITTTIRDYQALNGSNPAAGTAWTTSRANGGPYMQSWPNGQPYYSIEWNGSALSVVPSSGTASHGSIGTSAPATGCFAA